MRLVRWRHDRRTMPHHHAGPADALDVAALGPLEGNETILTFRALGPAREALARFAPAWEERRVDATTRFRDCAATLVLAGLETDTRLAPLILWDLFHAAPVGARLRLVEDFAGSRIFDRRYYAGALRVEGQAWHAGCHAVTYRKIAPAPITADAGLDAWTFGIPSGPGDASALNACVGRILELDLPQVEIVLCGQVGANFLYPDRVRIIGQDMPSTPIRIAEKKNRLAAAASHGNLCLLHDRVILPRGFGRAVRAFGDDYPFTTFQSFYFYDRWNLHGQRYADIETLDWEPTGLYEALPPGQGGVQPRLFGEERYRQAYGHATVYTGQDYVIGGLYMAKRTVWTLCPQDGSRGWMEWEDIEHGTRAARDWGIPGRINPHAFTQSLAARFRTLGCQWQAGDDGIRQFRLAPTWPWLPSPSRKPHLRLGEEAYRAGMRRFCQAHVSFPHRAEVEEAVRSMPLTFRGRTTLIHLILARSAVRRDAAAVERFIRDFFTLLVGEGAEPPYYWRSLRDEILNGDDPERLRRAPMRHWVVRGPLRWFPLRRMFGGAPADIMARPAGPGLVMATALTAVFLRLFRRRAVHFPGGIVALTRALLDCTPTLDLLERRPLPGSGQGADGAP